MTELPTEDTMTISERLRQIAEYRYDLSLHPEMRTALRAAADRLDALEARRLDTMASRLQEMADRVGCPLGLDIIDWSEDRIYVLEAELARFVPVQSPFEVFTAGDGGRSIRGRTDLYERRPAPDPDDDPMTPEQVQWVIQQRKETP